MKTLPIIICFIFFSFSLFAQNEKLQDSPAAILVSQFAEQDKHIVAVSETTETLADIELATAGKEELIYGVFNSPVASNPNEVAGSQEQSGKILNVLSKPLKDNPSVVKEGIAYVVFNLQNGPIQKGDYITISNEPGVGMKATESGFTVGVALENSDATEKPGLLKIRVMVRYEKM